MKNNKIAILTAIVIVLAMGSLHAQTINTEGDLRIKLTPDFVQLYEAKKYEEALPLIKKAAVAGDAKGQCYLGKLYSFGYAVEQDYAEAMRWYQKAAAQNYPEAFDDIGYAYYAGQGVEQSYTEAVKWWRKAASSGIANSQHNLGVVYENGQGVNKDYEEAIRWYQLASKNGNEDSYSAIADMYRDGRGVQRHCSKAMFYFQQAVEMGYEDAKEDLKALYNNGCRIYEPVEFPNDWLRIPVFEFNNPSRELAKQMENNQTYSYFKRSNYMTGIQGSLFGSGNSSGSLRKSGSTQKISFNRNGIYSTLKHIPSSGYSRWFLPQFNVDLQKSTPFWRTINLQFFYSSGTDLSAMELPFQFLTSYSNTAAGKSVIYFSLSNDGTLRLKTVKGDKEYFHFISEETVKTNTVYAVGIAFSNDGGWLLYLNGDLLAEGKMDADFVNTGVRNEVFFEGAINIVSMNIYERYAKQDYEQAYGLSAADLQTVDKFVASNMNPAYFDCIFRGGYDNSWGSAYTIQASKALVKRKSYSFLTDCWETIGPNNRIYDNKCWQSVSYEKIYQKRIEYRPSKNGRQLAGHRVGLIVTGRNKKGEYLSFPFQYEVLVSSDDKTIARDIRLYSGSDYTNWCSIHDSDYEDGKTIDYTDYDFLTGIDTRNQ